MDESDDDDDEDDVLTSPEAKQRMIPRKGGRANGTAGGASGVSVVDVRDSPAPNGGGGVAASPESDDGTSSGSEDVCWFKKPSKGGGGGGGRVGGAVGRSTVKVERAKAMANPGARTIAFLLLVVVTVVRLRRGEWAGLTIYRAFCAWVVGECAS